MTINWTQHVQNVLSKRKIPIDWINIAVDNPDKICADDVDPELEHYLKVIPEFGNRVLRVVLNVKSNPPRLITFYFDRKMKGKL